MRKFMVVFLVTMFAVMGVLVAGTIEEAHALKAEGKYVEAAAEHPQSLCRAVYLLNAAAQVISQAGTDGRDSTGRWLYNNLNRTTALKAEVLLSQAQDELAQDDGKGCAGTSVKKVTEWMDKMQGWVGPLLPKPTPAPTPAKK